jgi:hypothetical protein
MKQVLALALLALVASASAAIIIQDDFESYADTTALNGPWPKGTGTDAATYLLVGDNGPTWPGEKCVENLLTAARRDWSFTPTALAAGEELIWAFDLKDMDTTVAFRQFGQILSKDAPAGALDELIAMGVYNAADPNEVFNANKYYARVAFGPGGVNWFALNTTRSAGWHRFEAHIKKTGTVDFYVDGVLDTAGVPHGGDYWYQARIGSGLSSTRAARYDNYLVNITPEPASLALVALGLLAFRRR